MTEPWETAGAAAQRAGVHIRALVGLEEMRQACALLDAVWQLRPGEHSENHPALFQALASAGNYLVGGWTAEGRLVTVSVAFFGPPEERLLHSHITGTSDIGRGIGAAVKWHQRAWCLDRDVPTIGWTFDPLVARNARFNLVRLGARPTRYLENVYGEMPDGRNAGQPSDRLYARWDLRSPEVVRAARGAGTVRPSQSGETALHSGPGGEPITTATTASRTTVHVPEDIESLRRTDPHLALAWRRATRRVFTELFGRGYEVTDFHDPACYSLNRPTTAEVTR